MIRAYEAGDMLQIRELYRQQDFPYELPNFNAPSFPIRLVSEVDGKIAMAAFAHVTAELYMFVDGDMGTPEQRWELFKDLHRRGIEAAYFPGGLDDLHAFLPPQIEKSFGRRLMRLGWQKALWPCYTIGVNPHG